MKIDIKKIEEVTGYKVKENFTSIGFDIATRTGVCLIKSSNKYCSFEWFFVEFDKSSRQNKFKTMIETFENIITDKIGINIIEDTYLKYFGRHPQVNVLKQLTRYGAFAISKSIREHVDYIIIGATDARSKLKINTSKKAGYGKGKAKQAVADYLKNNFDIKLDDEDASDAIILALLGILEGVKFS